MSIDVAYAELGLRPGASEAEVRAAFRRLAARWHPDRNPSPEAVAWMQRINRAYDAIREAAFNDDFAAADADAASGADAASPARTLRRRLRLSIEEAAFGCTKTLRGRLTRSCAACGGYGRDRIDPRCGDCDGSGVIAGTAWFGWLSTEWTCPACKGHGTVARACAACDGSGETASAWRRTLRIPAGVRHADVLVAAGPPDADGRGELELEVEIEIAPHRLFEAGDDGSLRCEMPVDGFAWIANAWIEVPTLAGLQQMRLQRGRRVYRLRGQGLPLHRGATARGDYLVTVIPTFPDTLSKRQQSLLEQLAKSANGADADTPPSLRTWRKEVESWTRSRAARAPHG